MLRAVFGGHEGFIVLALIVVGAGGLITWRSLRGRSANAGMHACWAAASLGIVALTMWTDGTTVDTVAECVINKDVLEPFRTVQGRLNAGMFVPFGVLGVLATRRPLLVLSLGVLLTASIETVQSVVPLVARICDSSDLVANVAGVVAGVALGMLVTRLDSGGAALPRKATRRFQISALTAVVLIGASWAVWITPRVVERTVNDIPATAAQTDAVTDAVREALGEDYSVESVQFTAGEGDKGSVTAALRSPHGSGAGAAELSWPGREQFTVNLVPTQLDAGHALTVTDAGSKEAATKEEAEDIATTYARRHAPWGVKDAKVSVTPLDKETNIGWMVSWRRRHNGVLLPMRLDIQIEPSGRITDLIMRDIADPELPAVRYSEEQVWATFNSHFGLSQDEGEREAGPMAVRRDDGEWGVDWMLSATTDTELFTTFVDAVTGKIRNPARVPVQSDVVVGQAG